MKTVLKISVKSVSVIITLLMIIRFISLLDLISFDFGVVGNIGRYIPGWYLGLIGSVMNFSLSKKISDTKFEFSFFRISAFFCAFVALLDLFLLYISSQI